jgi:hypothetical protein
MQPYSQELSIFPYPEPDQSSPWLSIPLWKTNFEVGGVGGGGCVNWSDLAQDVGCGGWLFKESHWISSPRKTETWIPNTKDPEFTHHCPVTENTKHEWQFLQHLAVMERKFNKTDSVVER